MRHFPFAKPSPQQPRFCPETVENFRVLGQIDGQQGDIRLGPGFVQPRRVAENHWLPADYAARLIQDIEIEATGNRRCAGGDAPVEQDIDAGRGITAAKNQVALRECDLLAKLAQA